jgi:HEAT repeat protein
MGAAELSSLREAVVARRGDAFALARASGPEGVDVLRELAARHDEVAVRELAAYGLAAHPERREEHLRALLSDPSASVRRAALSGLPGCVTDASVPTLLALSRELATPFERFELGKLFGALGEPTTRELRALADAEPDPIARRGLVLGLARRGEADARRECVALLEGFEGWARLADDHVPYLLLAPDAAWLAPTLVALLDEERVARWLGHRQDPEYIRICDLAVGWLVPLLGLDPRMLDAGSVRHFTPEERARVRAAAQAALGG